jgi:predicted protein tyrosine phosphatase
MIKDFYVYSRPMVELIEPHEVPHLIVSISTPGDEGADIRTNEHTLKLLRLWFWDFDKVPPGHEEAGWAKDSECFQPSQAQQILDVVKQYPEAERLIVHCDAGYSRSPAVAAALSKILLGDDSMYFQRYRPNMRVYRTILEVYYDSETGES